MAEGCKMSKISKWVHGEPLYNLQIEATKLQTPLEKNAMPLEHILKTYTGFFRVTEKGYLLEGRDERLYTAKAILDMNNTLNRDAFIGIRDDILINYETGLFDNIIYTIIGLRLESVITSSRERKRKVAREGIGVCLV
jgi:hypothetical protein